MSGAISPYRDKLKGFRTTLARMGPQIAMAAPSHIRADRMMRMCMTVVQQNPKLLDCTKESLLGAIMTAAQLGLYPDVSVLGHAYFVPFKSTVVFIAGYKGLIDLAARGGHVTSIHPYAVYEGDDFEYEYGLNPTLRHKPSGEPLGSREMTHVYCIARIRGEPIAQFVVMTKEEIDNIRKRSPARNNGPWVTDYEPMALKSVVRREVKYLPISSELQRVVALDEHADVGLDQGLEAVGAEVIAGLIPEDEVLDADFVVENEEESGDGTSTLDGVVEDMPVAELDEYTKTWARGNEILGDSQWKKIITDIRKKMKIGSAKYPTLPVATRDALIKEMEAAIKDAGNAAQEGA
jgi:recombination protein RecT